MKEEKQEIATNVSSGAEKVEKVEKQLQQRDDGKKTVINKTKTTVSKGKNTKAKAAKKEKEAAQVRVETALKKKDEQKKRAAERQEKMEKRAAERKAAAEKRAAERKEKAAKRAAERKAAAEKRLAEVKAWEEQFEARRAEKRRERAHRKATRAQQKNRAQQKKHNERRGNGERRNQKKDYGGWLAAVISLGAVSLALTAALVVGGVDMRSTKEGMLNGYRATTYELIGIMDNVDNDLDRARISASPVQQSRILTDLLVQARLAEVDLEKMPISQDADANLTGFINRVAAESERMLAKLRRGETLSERDQASLQQLYEINHEVRMQLDNYAQSMTGEDIMEYMKKGEGALKGVLDKLEEATLPENHVALPQSSIQPRGAGIDADEKMPVNGRENEKKIQPFRAEELCENYFQGYKIQEFQCIGETVAKSYTAYNVEGYDDRGNLLFAEVDATSGELLRFDYYELCQQENFTVENSKRIAEEFLDKLGYDDMVAVRVRENGTDADFTFVYEDDGVLFYPDTIHVKICRSRGVVAGFDATKYALNHKDREDVEARITLLEAKNSLHKDLSVQSSRLVVISAHRGERSAYEFVCSYGEDEYLIYTDATTGEEISIVNLKTLN